jgi:uncharacterized protein
MNALNFLDANVWMALLWNRHVRHQTAQQWFQRSADERFLFCRLTQLTTLRLLTTPSVMGDDVQTMSGAWNLWDTIESDPRIFLLAEPDGLDSELRAQSKSSARSPKVWADAYLVAFAGAAGVKLVTFDRALKSRRADVLVL